MSPAARRIALRFLLPLAVLGLTPLAGAPAPLPESDPGDPPLPPGALFRIGSPSLQHGGMRALACSRDDKMLASAGAGGIRLWEPYSGKLLHRLRDDTEAVTALAFSADGLFLVAGGLDGRLTVWNARNGERGRSTAGRCGAVRSLAFTATDQRLVVAGQEGVAVWNFHDGEEVRAIPGLDAPCFDSAVSPDGKCVVLARADGWTLFDLGARKEVRHSPGDLYGRIRSLVWSQNGESFASIDERGRVYAWDPNTGRRRASLPESVPSAERVAWSPDGKILAGCDESGGLWFCALGKNHVATHAPRNPSSGVVAMTFAPDGKSFATACVDGRIRRRSLEDGREFSPWGLSVEAVFSGDGRSLLTLTTTRQEGNGIVRRWDARTGAAVPQFGAVEQRVNRWALAPDGKTFALRDNGGLALWDAETGKPQWRREREGSDIYAESFGFLAFSPDGRSLAAAGNKGVVRGYDTATGRPLEPLLRQESVGADYSSAGTFSPDGRTLVLAGNDHPLRAWDIATGKEKFRLRGHGGSSSVSRIVFAPGGSRLATVADDAVVCVWDAENGRLLRRIPRNVDGAGCLAFAPDGKFIATNAEGDRVALYDSSSGEPRGAFSGHERPVTSVSFAPDGRTLVSGSEDGTALVWDLTKAAVEEHPPAGERRDDPLPAETLARLGENRWQTTGEILDVTFAPDGKTLAGNDKHRAYLWDAVSGRELRRWEIPESRREAQRTAFSPDGKILAVVSGFFHSELLFWDTATGRFLGKPICQSQTIQGFAFSPDGRTVACVGGPSGLGNEDPTDCAVQLWDLATGEKIRNFLGHDKPVREVAFSADGTRLVSRGADERTWEVASGKQLTKRALPNAGAVFSTDGARVAYYTKEKNLIVRDAAGRELWRTAWATQDFHAAFSRDGALLATTGFDQEIQLWDAATGRPLRRCRDNGKILRFSPDGALLATIPCAGRSGGAVRVWEVASGKELRSGVGHARGVGCLKFSSDGKHVLTRSSDGTVRLWRSATGKEIQCWDDHEAAVAAVAFSGDGKFLASADVAGGVQLRELTGKEIARFKTPPAEVGGRDRSSVDLAFTAAGHLVVVAPCGTVCRWEASTGKERTILCRPEWGPVVALSDDGRFAAFLGPLEAGLPEADDKPRRTGIRVVDLASAKTVGTIVKEAKEDIWVVALAPDGKTLAVGRCEIEENHGFRLDCQVRVFETATGGEILRREVHTAYLHLLRFGADGRTLFAAEQSDWFARDYRSLRSWDLATGRELPEFTAHSAEVWSLAVSADGRRLASGGADGTALIHAAPRLVLPAPAGAFSPRELAALAVDLEQGDAGQAHRAMWSLAAAPDQAVALLRRRLEPQRPADVGFVRRCVTDLDDKEFDVRQRAEAELEKLGELAADALRSALAKGPPLEMRRRLDHLLEKAETGRTAERLREARVVALLERIGAASARRYLQELAEAAPGTHLSRQACDALNRLTARERRPGVHTEVAPGW